MASTNHQFPKIHHQNPMPRDLFLLSRSESSNEICLVKFDSNKDLHVEEVLPYPVPNAFDNVLCAGDGLVLLRTTLGDEEEGCVLWNPSNKKQTMIRYPDWCDTLDIIWADYGFCHDPDSEDYKIVLTCKKYYSVFSCKNRTWTEKQDFNYNIDTYADRGLFVDGFTFWFFWGATNEDDKVYKEILYYDHRDDKFKKLHKPKLLEGVDTFSFTKIRGRLCLYNIIESGMVVRMHIWMMEGHVDSCNWSELMIIDDIPVVDTQCISSIRPMFFTQKNEMVVMFKEPRQDAMVYSSSTEAFEKYYGPEELLDRRMIPYVDSMFFPIEAEEEA